MEAIHPEDIFMCCLFTAVVIGSLSAALGYCNGRLAEIRKQSRPPVKEESK